MSASALRASAPERSEGAGPLISKPFNQQTAEEFHAMVTGFYELRRKGSAAPKPAPVAEGLRLSRTKKGAISIVRTKAKRPFSFVTQTEVELLARQAGFGIAETWNAFRAKGYIIASDRMNAERTYAAAKGVTL